MMRNLGRYVRIDWPRVVDNLIKCGMTTQEIADAAGIRYGTLREYRKDEQAIEPAYWAGVNLLALWASKTGCNVIDAPTRRITPSVSEVLREYR